LSPCGRRHASWGFSVPRMVEASAGAAGDRGVAVAGHSNLRPPYPADSALREGLEGIFRRARPHARLEIVSRQLNPFTSTFASEKVVCRVDGEVVRLFCKYGTGRNAAEQGADPKLLGYETEIYRSVLPTLQVSTPLFHGAILSGLPHSPWLFIEDLDGATQLDKSPTLDVYLRAAAWIARFHDESRALLDDPRARFIRRFVLDDYLAPIEPIGSMDLFGAEGDWLGEVIERYCDLAPILTDDPVLTHGEYYPQNILVRGDRIAPVDWQGARIGAAEVDLAMLTDAWSNRQTARMVQHYRSASRQKMSDESFERRFLAARIYVQLYWLTTEPGRVRFLRSEARHLGVKVPKAPPRPTRQGPGRPAS